MKLVKKLISLIVVISIIAGFSIQASAATDRVRIEAFVERCYSVVLGRESDPTGRAYWVDGLASGERTGISVAYGFFFSPEYKSYEKTNEQFLMDLYNTFLEGRNPDPTGWGYWLERMSNGEDDKEVIFNGFACSQEYMAYCAEYGVISGSAMTGRESARNHRDLVESEGMEVGETRYISTAADFFSNTGIARFFDPASRRFNDGGVFDFGTTRIQYTTNDHSGTNEPIRYVVYYSPDNFYNNVSVVTEVRGLTTTHYSDGDYYDMNAGDGVNGVPAGYYWFVVTNNTDTNIIYDIGYCRVR